MDRNYYKGEIYYSNMGNHNGSVQGGVRPVIIVQNDIGNRYSPTVIVATISTQLHKAKLPTHVVLEHVEAGLKKPSFVMLEQIRTVNKSDLGSFVGKVNDDNMEKINKASEISLGLEETKSKYEQMVEENRQKILKEAKRKARLVNETEIGISFLQKRGYATGNDLGKELREREMYLKDLINYCNKNSIDYREVYTMYTSTVVAGDSKVRMVG